MAFTTINWQDGITPLSASNLNRFETGIKWAHDNIGDPTTLSTTAKTLVPAINELFLNVDNGKNNIYSAIVGKGVTPASKDFSDLTVGVNNIKRGQGVAVETQVLYGVTFANQDGTLRTGTMPNRTAANTAAVSVDGTSTVGRVLLKPANGWYNEGGTSWTYADDADFVPKNIDEDVALFGLQGQASEDPITTGVLAPGLSVAIGEVLQLDTDGKLKRAFANWQADGQSVDDLGQYIGYSVAIGVLSATDAILTFSKSAVGTYAVHLKLHGARAYEQLTYTVESSTSVYTGGPMRVVPLTATEFLLVYPSGQSSSRYMRYRYCSWNGTTGMYDIGAATVLQSSDADLCDVLPLANNNFVLTASYGTSPSIVQSVKGFHWNATTKTVDLIGATVSLGTSQSYKYTAIAKKGDYTFYHVTSSGGCKLCTLDPATCNISQGYSSSAFTNSVSNRSLVIINGYLLHMLGGKGTVFQDTGSAITQVGSSAVVISPATMSALYQTSPDKAVAVSWNAAADGDGNYAPSLVPVTLSGTTLIVGTPAKVSFYSVAPMFNGMAIDAVNDSLALVIFPADVSSVQLSLFSGQTGNSDIKFQRSERSHADFIAIQAGSAGQTIRVKPYGYIKNTSFAFSPGVAYYVGDGTGYVANGVADPYDCGFVGIAIGTNEIAFTGGRLSNVFKNTGNKTVKKTLAKNSAGVALAAGDVCYLCTDNTIRRVSENPSVVNSGKSLLGIYDKDGNFVMKGYCDIGGAYALTPGSYLAVQFAQGLLDDVETLSGSQGCLVGIAISTHELIIPSFIKPTFGQNVINIPFYA